MLKEIFIVVQMLFLAELVEYYLKTYTAVDEKQMSTNANLWSGSICPLRKSDPKALNIVVDRLFMTLFQKSSMDIL